MLIKATDMVDLFSSCGWLHDYYGGSYVDILLYLCIAITMATVLSEYQLLTHHVQQINVMLREEVHIYATAYQLATIVFSYGTF